MPSGHVQLQGYNAIRWLEWRIAANIDDVVVMERMNLNDPRAKRATANLQMGLNVIGCVRYFCNVADVELVEQWNRDKNQVSDELLEEHGMLAKPKSNWRHANDAARHALFHLTKLQKKGNG